MEVKVIFRSLDEKSFITDFSNVDVKADEILVRELEFNFFTKEELFKLANTCGITIIGCGQKVSMYLHKAYCSIEFMPNKEDRVKYLTDKIDKLSSELNQLVNQ